jgi:signal transduction histidine kinase
MTQLLGLDEPTLTLVRAFHQRVAPQLDGMLDELWASVRDDEGVRGMLSRDKEDFVHWRSALRVWLDFVLSGAQDDPAAIVPWLPFGERFLAAELPQELVLGAMTQLRQSLLGLVFELDDFAGSKDQLALAVCRVIDRELTRLLERFRYRMQEQLLATERLAAMGQLVASIGHELRNPLSTIETSAYLLTRKLTSSVEGDIPVIRHLEKIRRQVRVATKTVADLLELAQNRLPRRKPTLLRASVDDAIDGLSVPDSVILSIAFDETIEVFADANQLRIMLVNLLSNAFDAVSGRGQVTISASASREGVSIRVSDDGPGIPESERDNVFRALFTTKPNGNGLGLPLCRRIAEAHGGRLRLEPTERGASFLLWLPVAETNAPTSELKHFS